MPALRAGERVPLNHWIHGKAPNDDGIVVSLHFDVFLRMPMLLV